MDGDASGGEENFSPFSPTQNDETSLAETNNVNMLKKHPSETVIDGNFVATNYESIQRFMTLKDNMDHMGIQITHCTRGDESAIATRIAEHKEEMQGICKELNVLYGRLPPNQKALDIIYTTHLEQLENAKKRAAAAAAAKAQPPQQVTSQKRKTPMSVDAEGYITPGSRKTKKGTIDTPNPTMPLPPSRTPDFSYAAATTNRPRPQAPQNKPLDESSYEFLTILLRLARDNSLNADGIFDVVIDLIPELESLNNPHLKGAKILQEYSRRYGL
ncbi:hypothetical protein CDAR_513361 [Caerostris darwini]|uniref:Uncharacterized protein n=1 Tax=Caerostris darwini TaxID=1538125 RepID=A0AAV4MR75_9ARAC|nr:hypothetical protein CDAR_513361 [Caerostris darwini]